MGKSSMGKLPKQRSVALMNVNHRTMENHHCEMMENDGNGDCEMIFSMPHHPSTGWGPQDSVQLPYKWLKSMVYGRHNYIS